LSASLIVRHWLRYKSLVPNEPEAHDDKDDLDTDVEYYEHPDREGEGRHFAS